MSDFVPPYPYRFPTPPPEWRRALAGSKSSIAIWEEQAFETDFAHARVLMRDTFLCNCPDAVQFFFNTHNPSFERKSPQHRRALEPLLGDGLFVSDGATWRQRRKIVAPIVHVTRLPRFAPIMTETAAETLVRWDGIADGRIDALSEMAHLTAQIIARTVFGTQLGRKYVSEIVEGFSTYQAAISQANIATFLNLPEWMSRYNNRRVRRALARVLGVLDQIIADCRRRTEAGEDSMIRQLIEARDDETGAPLSDDAIRNEAGVLFMAGHETTANSLAWTWYLLSQAPDVEARLHAELENVLGGRLPTLDDVPQLIYTRAIFEEAMRLYPPVPILGRETIQEEHFEGTRIPVGSLIFVVPWLLHRHKNLWEKPDHFMPERFLPDNARGISKYAYIPFSIGPRVCAGLQFGLTEAILSIATLAQYFKLRLAPGAVVEPTARLSLRPAHGLPMTLEARGARPFPSSSGRSAATPTACPYHHA